MAEPNIEPLPPPPVAGAELLQLPRPKKVRRPVWPRAAAAASAVVLFAAVPPWLAARGYSDATVWGWSVSLGLACLVSLSLAAGNLLLDERRRYSLSRFQLVLWTWLVLSSFWGMVLVRMFAGVDDALALTVDENLWILMGISGASFVASPLILEHKRAKDLLDVEEGDGALADLFRGEEKGNKGVVDIGRVQLFFLTAVAAIAFFAACLHQVRTVPSSDLAFPKLSEGLLALLGISHATYLGNKIPDRPGKSGGTT